MDDLEQRVFDLNLIRVDVIRDERDDRVFNLESTVEAYEEWLPRVECSLHDLRTKVGRLAKHWDPTVVEPVVGAPDLMPSPESFAMRSSTGFPIDWPKGQDVDSPIRETHYGSVTTIVSILTNGTLCFPSHPPPSVLYGIPNAQTPVHMPPHPH